MAKSLSADQIESFKENGYIILQDLLTQSEVLDLKSWAQEVHDWEPAAQSKFMPYEVRTLLFITLGESRS
jgi:hypothetical protein